MTTENMQYEHSDADYPVVENTSVSETMTSPVPLVDAASAEAHADTHQESFSPQHEEQSPASAPESAEQNQTEQAQSNEPAAIEPAIAAAPASQGADDKTPFVGETEMRPFTSFIEEFQQEQSRVGIPEPELETGVFVTFSPEAEPMRASELTTPDFVASWEQAALQVESSILEAQSQRAEADVASLATVPSFEEVILAVPAVDAAAPVILEILTAPEETQQAAQAQRPVSPLLRPASRIRVPRHQRQREQAAQPMKSNQTAQTPASVPTQIVQEETPLTTATTETTAEVPSGSTAAETSAQTPATSEPAQTRPARRYRFDRPAPAASAATTTPARTEEYKEIAKAPASIENEHTANGNDNGNSLAQVTERPNQQGQQSQKYAAAPAQPVETPAVEATTETNGGQAATAPVEHDRRRRHGQERQREKEQAHATPAASTQAAPTPVAETVPPVAPTAPVAQTAQVAEPVVASVQTEEVNPEDLPPLEYADLQAANSRRRRRRRPASAAGTTPTVMPVPIAKAVTPEVPPQETPIAAPVPIAIPAAALAPTVTPAAAPASSVSAPRAAGAPAGSPYNIVSGYTVGQMNQNGDGVGPFMGPDPSPARGSMPSHNARTGRAEVQRPPAYPALRADPSASAASVNHLANVVAQAIQGQTDRMVTELRRANQGPTNVSVTLPPFPSTERVGVFVDVANLLYSARTMRINIDFGKLLDFLRGNRRLVRAQAYCPTSPQPGDEQMFLQAVKGLGYRITTKNYKTFSSGAKKADLDLDLCMDVVRLVDGRAVDCVVLVSGDSDFMPMLDYCSDHGVRVEVAAFDEAMSATLRQSCDLFINLSMLGEIRS